MKYNLIDYKGKFTIIQDKGYEGWYDSVVGEITHEQAVKDVDWRSPDSIYYGVPAYVGSNEELKKLYANS